MCHQLWESNVVGPVPLKDAQSSVMQLCEDMKWDYQLWTESKWMDLLDENYPFLKSTYAKIPTMIQKAHMAKYLIMYHHGGMVLDMDVTPTHELRAWMTENRELIIAKEPHGYAHTVMLARSKHPFFKALLHNIVKFQPTNVTKVFRHYDILSRTGKFPFEETVKKFEKLPEVHIQASERPLVSSVLTKPASTWREWDSYVYEYAERLWQYRDKILLCSTLFISLVIIILIASQKRRPV